MSTKIFRYTVEITVRFSNIKNVNHRFLHILSICIALTVPSACSLFEPTDKPTNEPIEILIENETFTLAWDPPSSVSVDQEIVEYNIYVRKHGKSDWHALDTMEATGSPSIELNATDIGKGSWEFAVSTISNGGMESEYHSSIDPTAVPTDWYIRIPEL